jgi:hypothetical protein
MRSDNEGKASEDERHGKNEVAWESAGYVGSTARSRVDDETGGRGHTQDRKCKTHKKLYSGAHHTFKYKQRVRRAERKKSTSESEYENVLM